MHVPQSRLSRKEAQKSRWAFPVLPSRHPKVCRPKTLAEKRRVSTNDVPASSSKIQWRPKPTLSRVTQQTHSDMARAKPCLLKQAYNCLHYTFYSWKSPATCLLYPSYTSNYEKTQWKASELPCLVKLKSERNMREKWLLALN